MKILLWKSRRLSGMEAIITGNFLKFRSTLSVVATLIDIRSEKMVGTADLITREVNGIPEPAP
ncbi:MAG: hypothetical protein IIA59_00075 [Candidatus Marinimicrobia bacterium]|nr:hypothetical protein [Candidatus Neomarinimicrobiota bacterium]